MNRNKYSCVCSVTTNGLVTHAGSGGEEQKTNNNWTPPPIYYSIMSNLRKLIQFPKEEVDVLCFNAMECEFHVLLILICLQITQQYRSDIIKQINEKEHERIKKKQSKFEEEVALKMEELQRQGNMKDAIKKKIEELR